MLHSKLMLAVAALLLAGAGFARLGRWQLDRAEVNRTLEAGFEDASQLPVIDRPIAADAVDGLRFRRIRLSGRYEPGIQILLDNRTFEGRAGYEVLTPFLPAAGGRLVLVDRGWVPASPDRRVLPAVPFTGHETSVSGRIARLPRAALRLAAPPTGRGPLVVMSFPTFDEVATVLGRPVADFEILLDPDAADGFTRRWDPPPDRFDRNIAYAVQWFGLAALAFVLAIGIAYRRLRSASERAP